MLINGKPVQGNITGLIKKLGELPSSFPEYISNLTPKPLSTKEQIDHNQAAFLYNEGLKLYNKGNHLVALKQLQQAEQIAIGQTDINFLSYINTIIHQTV
ncbi:MULTISPECIES: hypothetical protein [spotted fever group]|uniref:Uncharacterized protein n=2 Tax=spotted fever group TaxID=114277 RepID=A0A0F3PFW2_RICRH|nr:MULTISPECIES: hypothetical protein [spotted fever group]AFB31089.1 hypothetical protein RMB_00805 [Rickettsia massiliae str. AZT80]KJV79255.1 hypothetical protein RMAECT_0562 [Rickettsia rhipicephali str. Ect]